MAMHRRVVAIAGIPNSGKHSLGEYMSQFHGFIQVKNITTDIHMVTSRPDWYTFVSYNRFEYLVDRGDLAEYGGYYTESGAYELAGTFKLNPDDEGDRIIVSSPKRLERMEVRPWIVWLDYPPSYYEERFPNERAYSRIRRQQSETMLMEERHLYNLRVKKDIGLDLLAAAIVSRDLLPEHLCVL